MTEGQSVPPRPGLVQPIAQGFIAASPWVFIATTDRGSWFIGAIAVVTGLSVMTAVRFYGVHAMIRGRLEGLAASTDDLSRDV